MGVFLSDMSPWCLGGERAALPQNGQPSKEGDESQKGDQEDHNGHVPDGPHLDLDVLI
jgi:hypothetical protein